MNRHSENENIEEIIIINDFFLLLVTVILISFFVTIFLTLHLLKQTP